MLALENSLVFFPSGPDDFPPWPPDPKTEDVWFDSADGMRIHGWWIPMDDPNAGVVLHAHGNGGNLSHWAPVAAELKKHLNRSVLLFDYPGYGKSGGKPSEKGCYDAAAAAYDWLTQVKKIDPRRIVLLGESLGGGVIVDLASRRDHEALVLFKTFTSLPDAAKVHYPWLPTRMLMSNRFDSLAKIKRCTRPVFVAHGTADDIVPFAQGERLFAEANEPKQFVKLESHGHNDGMPGEVFDAVRTFLAR
jgi:fermentation-respiration switch protein FrsA (DUF1100 family)